MSETTCQVFTPTETVKYMLDKIGYTTDLYGKRVLENSCGTGRFLCEIVNRYISDGRRLGRTAAEIKGGLERDICGIEKEKRLHEICMANLDSAAEEGGIAHVSWNIRLGDALLTDIQPIYQFVVGNPPYITYYNLSQEERDIIRTRYTTCRNGKADYYYAFTEAALKSLAPDGVMAYLIPGNFMKNRYSEDLRQYILPYLTELEDFKFNRLFGGRQTSSAIILCSAQANREHFLYTDRENGRSRIIFKDDLSDKWLLDYPDRDAGICRRFGDCFKVSAPVATLLNKAFIIRDYTDRGTFVEKDGFRLEKAGLRPTTSPKSMRLDEKCYIIFPYYYEGNLCLRYKEQAFTETFPQISAYLKKFEDQLSERKADKASRWFEYGRSQALNHINQEKLLLSTLITGRVICYRLDAETVPYSGMYIVPKKDHTISQAEQILKSNEFYEYVKSVGIHASGSTYRISPRDVENYIFEERW